MIIENLINISPEFKTKIDVIKIYITLIISLIITILLLSNDIFYYKLCSKIILIYVSIDIFFSKKDSIFHHIFCYFLCSYITFNNVDLSIDSIIYKTMLQTETSTIFYMFRLIIDLYKNEIEKSRFNKIIKYYSYLNDIIFIILFYKLRINDYFYNVIQNDNMYFLINLYNKNSLIEDVKIFIGIYGLFTLNLYWFMIMFKKLYKQIVVNNKLSINSLVFSEYILKYTFYINLLIALNYYIKNYNKYTFLDLVGIFILSIASGNYHCSKYNYILDIYKQNEEKPINNSANAEYTAIAVKDEIRKYIKQKIKKLKRTSKFKNMDGKVRTEKDIKYNKSLI
jgi:hypothetical protein